MRRKKQFIHFKGKNILLLSSILALNFLGLTYAGWNDGVGMLSSISTGKIDPVFCQNVLIDKVKGEGDLSVHFDDPSTMEIEGKVTPDYKAFLHYCVINDGTIPVKYDGHPEVLHNDGLKVEVDQQASILRPGERVFSPTGNPKLNIDTDKKGLYNFEIDLPFIQWTKE